MLNRRVRSRGARLNTNKRARGDGMMILRDGGIESPQGGGDAAAAQRPKWFKSDADFMKLSRHDLHTQVYRTFF